MRYTVVCVGGMLYLIICVLFIFKLLTVYTRSLPSLSLINTYMHTCSGFIHLLLLLLLLFFFKYISLSPSSFSSFQDIEQLLTPFGKVISSRILREPNGYSRGVGFVRYCACTCTHHA